MITEPAPGSLEWLLARREVWEAEKVNARDDLTVLKRIDKAQCTLRCQVADEQIRGLSAEIAELRRS